MAGSSANTGSDWGSVPTQEHTFTTGRTATLRKTMPLTQMMDEGVFDGDLVEAFEKVMKGKLEDAHMAARFMRQVCIGMFHMPRVTEEGDGKQEGDEWVEVPFRALDDLEVRETVALAFESLKGAAGFRGDKPSPRARPGRKGVGSKTKPASRARARKS